MSRCAIVMVSCTGVCKCWKMSAFGWSKLGLMSQGRGWLKGVVARIWNRMMASVSEKKEYPGLPWNYTDLLFRGFRFILLEAGAVPVRGPKSKVLLVISDVL